MYYHPKIEKQIIEIFKNIKIPKYEQDNSEDLTDIKDGTIYKNLLESEDGELFKNNEAFSFLLNTDGISVCSKSKLTIWPFFLAINEIPKEERFLIENMILAGMIKSL
jgi:hypothetical protein